MRAVTRDHEELTRAAIDAHEGALIRFTGDGVFAAFADAGQAVRTAVSIQRSLSDADWPDVGRLRVRMGLNTGPCLEQGKDLHGPTVNMAARLHDAAHGGQVVATDATVASCAHLSDQGSGIDFFELGDYHFRGLSQPTLVYQVLAAGLLSEFPLLRSGRRGYDELPAELTTLIGRDELVAEVGRRVRERRIVSLVGLGGVGKSRIAVRVARRARRPFHNGIRFVDLAVVNDPGEVVGVVLASLGAQPAVGESEEEAAVRVLRPDRLLLLLDNCEHGEERVRDLVRKVVTECPGVHVLATSRQALDLAGENTVQVLPLAVPPAREALTLSEVKASAAVDLFVDCARSVDPSFAVDRGNAQVVAGLCRALDGMPLALELAAARLSVESIQDLARDGAALIDRLGPTPGGRGLSMRSVVDWSYQRLRPDDQRLLQRLSVFAAAFTRDMALAVGRSGAGPTSQAFDRLLRSSFVVRDAVHQYRFRLLDSAREHARAKLPPGAAYDLDRRHAELMLGRARVYGPMIRTGEEASASEVLAADFSEYRRAMTWYLREDRVDEAAEMLVEIFQFCHFQLLAEAHAWALDLASRIPADHPLTGDVGGAAALAAWFGGDTDRAVQLGLGAVDSAASGDRPPYWARLALVDALGYAGRMEELSQHFIALVREQRTSPEPFWQINALGYEALSFLMFGRSADAEQRVDRALALARQLGNPDCRHWALYCHARVLAPHDPERACVAYEEAMAATRSVGSDWNLSLDLVEWAGLKRQLGDPGAAAVGLLELLDLLGGSGNRSQLSPTLRQTAEVLAAAGMQEAASLVLLSRAGLPQMPKGPPEETSEDALSSHLRAAVGGDWSRLEIQARSMAEHDLIRYCKEALSAMIGELVDAGPPLRG